MTLMTTFPIPCAPRLRRFKDNRDNRDNIFSLLAHLAIALALHFVALPEQEEGEHMGYVYGLLLFALFYYICS